MNTFAKSIVTAGVAGIGLLATSSASALILVTAEFGPQGTNDCAGLFGGTGGVICDVGFALDPSKQISPIIAKYDVLEDADGNFDGFEIETNPNFASIDGSEFTIAFGTDNSSGTWSYNQGEDDPDVRYWVAKDGGGFILHWMIEDQADLEEDGVCATTTYNYDCLMLAQSVTSGDWDTLGQDLSHLTFYDTRANGNGNGNGGGGGGGQIPEPGTLALMGGALFGLWAVRRRKEA